MENELIERKKERKSINKKKSEGEDVARRFDEEEKKNTRHLKINNYTIVQ